MENQKQMKLNIDLKSAETIYSPNGNCIFAEGVILKKISKTIKTYNKMKKKEIKMKLI
jgi:hypothetical protein